MPTESQENPTLTRLYRATHSKLEVWYARTEDLLFENGLCDARASRYPSVLVCTPQDFERLHLHLVWEGRGRRGNGMWGVQDLYASADGAVEAHRELRKIYLEEMRRKLEKAQARDATLMFIRALKHARRTEENYPAVGRDIQDRR